MKDMMCDLETLGTVPGCSILSIGAVRFNEAGLGEEFYCIVSRPSCKDAGLHEDEKTIKWWEEQGEEARKVLHEADSRMALTLATALNSFNEFIAAVPGTRMWGNGADFDNAILRCAYHAASVYPKLGPFQSRCYRTLKETFKAPKIVRAKGTHHNALDDAKNQALHMIEFLRDTGVKL